MNPTRPNGWSYVRRDIPLMVSFNDKPDLSIHVDVRIDVLVLNQLVLLAAHIRCDAPGLPDTHRTMPAITTELLPVIESPSMLEELCMRTLPHLLVRAGQFFGEAMPRPEATSSDNAPS